MQRGTGFGRKVDFTKKKAIRIKFLLFKKDICGCHGDHKRNLDPDHRRIPRKSAFPLHTKCPKFPGPAHLCRLCPGHFLGTN